MSQIKVKNEVHNSVILPDMQEECLPAEYSKKVVTRLPTLQIHHDENNVQKLKWYYRKETLTAYLGILFCLIVWFLAIGINGMIGGSFGIVFCFLILGVSVIAVIYLYNKVSSNKESYYYHFLKDEINAFAEVEHFYYGKTVFKLPDSEKILPEVPRRSKTLNWMSCDVDEHLFKDLNIVGSKWTELVVHDDILGDYAGLKFRFIESSLIDKSRNPRYGDIIFDGQVFIFEHIPELRFRGVYQYQQNSECNTLDDFRKSFVKCCFNNETTEFRGGRLETENFVMNMVRLGRLLNQYEMSWTLHIHDGFAILAIPRDVNIFEPDLRYAVKSLKKIERELQLFVDILTVISQFDFIRKNPD